MFHVTSVSGELSQIDLIANTPGIFQETIPKRIELRITVIGRKVFATEIHSQTSAESLSDWRRADIERLPHDVHALPHDIEERCLKLLDRFDLAYGQSAANRSPRKNAYCRPFDLALDRSSAPSLRAEDRRIGLEHAQDDVADFDSLPGRLPPPLVLWQEKQLVPVPCTKVSSVALARSIERSPPRPCCRRPA